MRLTVKLERLPQFLWIRFQHLHFDERVFLGTDTFPGRSIVVHARLIVLRRKHGVPLSKFYFFSFL